MKPALAFLAWVYLATGIILGLILELSYLWGSTFGAPKVGGFFAYWFLFITSNVIGIVGAAFRVFFWLPSLAIWYFYEDTSFWFWLAPGLFIRTASGG